MKRKGLDPSLLEVWWRVLDEGRPLASKPRPMPLDATAALAKTYMMNSVRETHRTQDEATKAEVMGGCILNCQEGKVEVAWKEGQSFLYHRGVPSAPLFQPDSEVNNIYR
jgi:hypothetical protein